MQRIGSALQRQARCLVGASDAAWQRTAQGCAGGAPVAATTGPTAAAAAGPAAPSCNPAAAGAVAWQAHRCFGSTAAALAKAGKNRTRGGGGGSTGRAAAPAAPPPAPPPLPPNGAGEYSDDDEEEGTVEEAAEGMAEAFERLVEAAYEMLHEGKPMEAEYVLSEGAKQAEEILGKDAAEVAPLLDQLALIQYLHDRLDEAAESSRRAWDIMKKHDGHDGPATAIAALRHGAVLLAQGEPQEAQLLLAHCMACLESASRQMSAAVTDNPEDRKDIDEAVEKFETGLAEASFYTALAKLAQSDGTEAEVRELEPTLRNSLVRLAQLMGGQHPLVAGAIREHVRFIHRALDGGEDAVANLLYGQTIRLQRALDRDSDTEAMLQYQHGTLQYVMGLYADAADTLESAMHIIRTQFEGGEEHLLSVKQRLGVVYAMQGRAEEARALLEEVSPELASKLGEDNPISHELRFILAVLDLLQLEQQGGGGEDASKRQQLVGAMKEHLKALDTYGEDHMLVKKARVVYEQVVGSPAPAPVPAAVSSTSSGSASN